MAKTLSNMLPLQTPAPSFRLPDFDGKEFSLDSFDAAKGYLVMFICNHCPYVVHIRIEMVKLAKELQEKGIAVVAINSNDVENYPDDHPDRMREDAERYGYSFPYLYDESQNVAKAYDAACTPDFYLFDAERLLVYRGQLDDSRPGNDEPINGKDLRAAAHALLEGKEALADQKPSMGCNIKWKA